MYVEKCLDEVWIEVKCQTDSEIAGSPRNGFKASVCGFYGWGRATGWMLVGNCLRPTKLRIQPSSSRQVSVRGLSFVHERETAQIER